MGDGGGGSGGVVDITVVGRHGDMSSWRTRISGSATCLGR
jgi:hypothetical protein